MPTKKLRILFNSEASYLASGFGKIYKELIQGLFDTKKYEIAEFATYGIIQDPRNKNLDWKFYCNQVEDKDPRKGALNSDHKNQFGKWRFERVLLDFKPDVVFDLRDSHMFDYECQSPFRPFFHHCLMPTCDSHPQKNSWISDLIHTDAVFTYTDYAYEVIKKESGGKVSLVSTTTPCINLDNYSPVQNVEQHRQQMGLQPDIFLVGSVMRNQKRKLYPDLMASFRMFLDRTTPEIAKKTYLYLHTSYPDHGWELPDFMKEHGLCKKCLFTYVCNKCRFTFSSFFQDARCICPKCKQQEAVFPNVGSGVSEEHLINIYRLFDFYVQYANCEGLGYPAIEAASCGVPLACTNYSGMEDFVNKINATPIPIDKKFFDMENTAYRVYPDNDKCASILHEFFSQPSTMRKRQGFVCRQKTEKEYNWENFVGKYETYFDNIKLTGLQGKWDSKSRAHNPNTNMPNNLSESQFMDWVICNVLGEPERLNQYESLFWLRLLNNKIHKEGMKLTEIDRNLVTQQYMKKVEFKNFWENVRCNNTGMNDEDYLSYARLYE